MIKILGLYLTVAQIQDLTLELLQKCHQKCIYCSSGSDKYQNVYLKFETVKKIIDDFSKLGGKTVELSGGEPLLYKYLPDTIDYLKNYDIEIHLFTCCYVPDKKVNFTLIGEVDKVFVNLQAPNKDIHDYLTNNPGSYDNVINFINNCKDINMWVGTHMIPLTYNIDEIDEYIKLANYLKIDNVSLLRYVEQGRGRESDLKLNPDEILQLHNIINKYYNENNSGNVKFKIGCPLDFQFIYKRKKYAKPCVSGISRCVIRPNGNVIPCPAFKDTPDYVAGNVNHDSLENIWMNGEIFKKIRNFDYKKLKGFCSNCSFLDICKGRCLAQRIHEFDDFYFSPDPYCPLYLTQTNL